MCKKLHMQGGVMSKVMSEEKFRIKRVRSKTKLSLRQFSQIYGIPFEKLKEWEMGTKICPGLILELLESIVDFEINNFSK